MKYKTNKESIEFEKSSVLFLVGKKGEREEMILTEFTDGTSTTNFVGKKSAYADKEAFLTGVKQEFDYVLEELLKEGVQEKLDSLEADKVVHDGIYCRYYPRFGEEHSHLGLDSGYAFCRKGKGAFEVYVINVEELLKTLK